MKINFTFPESVHSDFKTFDWILQMQKYAEEVVDDIRNV
jgi:hypothetical protein